jgi:hypothetical protein
VRMPMRFFAVPTPYIAYRIAYRNNDCCSGCFLTGTILV